MSTISSTAAVRAEDPAERAEAMAVGGFLAGYTGATRTSYATDLRIFATWCRQADLSLLTVKGSHLELFGRWMEETGRMRSTIVRRHHPCHRHGHPHRCSRAGCVTESTHQSSCKWRSAPCRFTRRARSLRSLPAHP